MGAKAPLRVGQRVKFNRRNGQEAKGKITRIYPAYRGNWVEVDVSMPNGNNKLISTRESLITKY